MIDLTSSWNTNIEFMDRRKLEKIQEDKLKRQLRYVFENSSFFKKKFEDNRLKPDDIKSLNELEKIPTTTREEIQKNITETRDPYGGRRCIPPYASSIIYSPEFPPEGEPFYAMTTESDASNIVEIITRLLVMTEIKRDDKILNPVWSWSVLLYILSPVYVSQAPKSVGDILGCMVLSTEEVGPEAARMLMLSRHFKPSTLITPAPMLDGVENEAKNQNIPLKDLGYNLIIIRDRKGVISNEQKKTYEKTWNARIHRMLDIQDNLFWALDCTAYKGLHAWDDMYIVEAVDPDTGKPVAQGEKGLLTITNIFAEAAPIIRYQTTIECSVEKEPCACGRTHTRIIPQNY
ncbi:MAG: phenylacetate--CoA ligase family protein [Candidatus Lokiarchaeia archaeon]